MTGRGGSTHVLAISTLSDSNRYWGALKQAYARLPAGARWTFAVSSTDGAKAVNIIFHDSVESVRAFFEQYAAPFAATEYFEADDANAVGLPK
jgi:hypothetical protein